jgi:hypothetical protein
MDIKSLKDASKDTITDLFDLIKPSFIYRNDKSLSKITVERYHEMRLDLLFMDMYGLEANEVGLYLENIDVILYINGIDNFLNIKDGMDIIYPSSISDFDSFRLEQDDFDIKNMNIDKITVPSKSTRKDSTRTEFLNGQSPLSPVLSSKPRNPVQIQNGKFNIGGL